MSENSNPSHWDDLLSQIGVPAQPEPPKEPEAPIGEGFVEPESAAKPMVEASPPAPRVAKPARRPAEIHRPTSDWDRLAEDLGVPVQPRPVQESRPASPPVVERPAVKAPPPRAVSAEQLDEAEEIEAARRVVEREAFFHSPPLDNAVPTPAEVWETEISDLSDPLFLDRPASASDEEEAEDVSTSSPGARQQSEEREQADRKRGRRRRRGRRKGSRPAESAGSAEPGSVSEAAVPAAEDATAPADAASDASADEGPAGPSDGRPRRRRRRRGSDRQRKPETTELETTEPETVVAAPKAEGPDVAEGEEWDGGVEDGLGDVEEGDVEGDGDSDDQVATLSHRAIPTWEEAIKLVIGPNLEARAKHPNGGQQHRGSRRPRSDRPRKPN
jgi:ribonuclease E